MHFSSLISKSFSIPIFFPSNSKEHAPQSVLGIAKNKNKKSVPDKRARTFTNFNIFNVFFSSIFVVSLICIPLDYATTFLQAFIKFTGCYINACRITQASPSFISCLAFEGYDTSRTGIIFCIKINVST